MSNRKDGWSEADKQYLRDHWDTMTNEQFALQLNRSRISIQSMASKELGLKRSPAALSQRLFNSWKNRPGTWTKTEEQYLIDNWQTKTKKEMSAALGRTPSAIKSKGQKEMGLVKSRGSIKTILKRLGPNNKGFKKGNMPYNTIYGDEQTIRVRKNKNGPAYKWIRTGFKEWKQYHVWLWEQNNGPVPEGSILNFKNNDQMDVRIDNLFLTTRAEHAIRHSASLNLTDGFIANTIAPRDKELKQEVLKHPDLIELQRAKIQLNRTIKHHGEVTGN